MARRASQEAGSFPFAVTAWLGARWLRRRWLGAVPLALVVAVGVVATMVATETAQRTATAYRDHLAEADVGDVTINPAASTRAVDEVIRSLPGVRQVTTDAVFTVSTDGVEARPRGELLGSTGWLDGVRGSTDGRYTDMDRPVVLSGRMPEGLDEMAVTATTAEAEGVAVGDVVPLAFWSLEVNALDGARLAAYHEEIVEPIGVEELEVVGIVLLPGQVLPDDLYVERWALLSPELAARYDCLPETPPPGSTVMELHRALLPEGCAVRYRYWSLALDGGAAAVRPALDAYLTAVSPLNADLDRLSDLEPGESSARYALNPVDTATVRDRVEHAIQPTVAGLSVLAGAAGLITVVLAALLVARQLRRDERHDHTWRQLGVDRWSRTVVLATAPVLAVLVGGVVGIVVSRALGVEAVGLVADLDPGGAARDGVTVAGLAVVGVVLVATVVLSARLARASGRRADRGDAGAWLRLPLARSGSPVVADGLRSAGSRRVAAPTIAGGAVLTAVFAAAVVFGASLSTLVGTPRSFGWPWDMTAVTGFGYYGFDVENAGDVLNGDPDVASWAALAITNNVSVDGVPTSAIVGFDRASTVDLPLLRGELPATADEVAVGPSVAAARDLDVGDTVELGGVFDPPRRATVSGVVVLPSLGPYEADRVGSGDGLVVSERAFDTDHTLGLPVAAVASFVGVELHEGADRARVREELRALDLSGFPRVEHDTAVRPPEIIDARSTRSVPVVVAGTAAALIAAGSAFAAWGAARARRRNLAVLRSLGWRGAQARRSLQIQAVATMLAALAVGVPCGVVLGRLLWRAFAGELGVVPDPVAAWPQVLGWSAVALVLAVAVAWPSSWQATRRPPAEDLRAE